VIGLGRLRDHQAAREVIQHRQSGRPLTITGGPDTYRFPTSLSSTWNPHQ
jgi:hypothetical protein